MAAIALHIADPLLRMTAKALLEAEGHHMVAADAELQICTDAAEAVRRAAEAPALLLVTVGEVPAAVAAMRQGVFGYALLPLVPGELPLQVERALGARAPQDVDDDESLTLDAWEARHILATLRRCRYNQAEAARRLGIGRNTLWRKLKRFRAEQAPS
jgi:DNA-binding NtrC family response regulator